MSLFSWGISLSIFSTFFPGSSQAFCFSCILRWFTVFFDFQGFLGSLISSGDSSIVLSLFSLGLFIIFIFAFIFISQGWILPRVFSVFILIQGSRAFAFLFTFGVEAGSYLKLFLLPLVFVAPTWDFILEFTWSFVSFTFRILFPIAFVSPDPFFFPCLFS